MSSFKAKITEKVTETPNSPEKKETKDFMRPASSSPLPEVTLKESQEDLVGSKLLEQWRANIERYDRVAEKYDEYQMETFFPKECETYKNLLFTCETRHNEVMGIINSNPLPEENDSKTLYEFHKAAHDRFDQALAETERLSNSIEARRERLPSHEKSYLRSRQRIRETLSNLQKEQNTADDGIRKSNTPEGRRDRMQTFHCSLEAFLKDPEKMGEIRSLERTAELVSRSSLSYLSDMRQKGAIRLDSVNVQAHNRQVELAYASEHIKECIKYLNAWPQSIQRSIDQKMFKNEMMALMGIDLPLAPGMTSNPKYIYGTLTSIMRNIDAIIKMTLEESTLTE